MPLSKQPKPNKYHCKLNDKFIDSHYPHLAKKLFDNLALPPGLILKNKPIAQNICISNSKDSCVECMDNKQWDKLFELGEIKSGNKRTRKRHPETKKKTKKSRKK